MPMDRSAVTCTVPGVAGAERLIVGVGMLVLGVLLLGAAGFAQLDVIHNAAHDGRHAFAFPCH